MIRALALALLLSGCTTIELYWEEKPNGVKLPRVNLGNYHIKAKPDQLVIQYKTEIEL